MEDSSGYRRENRAESLTWLPIQWDDTTHRASKPLPPRANLYGGKIHHKMSQENSASKARLSKKSSLSWWNRDSSSNLSCLRVEKLSSRSDRWLTDSLWFRDWECISKNWTSANRFSHTCRVSKKVRICQKLESLVSNPNCRGSLKSRSLEVNIFDKKSKFHRINVWIGKFLLHLGIVPSPHGVVLLRRYFEKNLPKSSVSITTFRGFF